MPAPSCPTQFDLFEVRPEPSRQRGGLPRHVPTAEQMLLANELKALGKNRETIRLALGVSLGTLAKRYFPSTVGKRSKGRPRHVPDADKRKFVRRAILGGMPAARVAKLIGISPPTLWLYYRAELQP